MRIPEEKIEEIRNSADIVDLVSGYVQLKKRGKNFIGLCPFHQEKTPSFTVSQDKQIFHCFGCHVGGNAFKFLMEFKSISFIEAVEEVAESVGITIQKEDSISGELKNELETYYEINVTAARFFSDNLLKNSAGKIAAEYLSKRNLKQSTQKIFGLGYALQGWDEFVNLAKANNIDLEMANKLGLIDKKDGGGYYDKFRDRIIFPIFSTNGRVIGFGGRILQKNTETAKYLNSPESPVYQKRRSLYGLYHAKDEIRKLDKAILVEGYMDLISLYQFGVKNVVASSGTALTEEQAQLLSRFTRNLVVLFDADAAGQNAAMRSIEILLKHDFEIKILSLPNGEDPDTFINKNGKDAFDEVLLKAQSFLDYQSSRYEAMGWFADASKQTEAIRELVKSIALVNDELKRTILIKNIARKFRLRENLIETELGKELNKNFSRDLRSSRALSARTQEKIDKVIVEDQKENSLEKEFIKLLFEGNEAVIGYILDNVPPEDFKTDKFRYIAEIICDAYKKNIVSPSAYIEKIDDPDIKNFILNLTMKEESISEKVWEEYVSDERRNQNLIRYTHDTLKKYRLQFFDEQIRDANAQMSKAENESQQLLLLKKLKELNEERKEFLNSEDPLNDNY